VERALVTFSIAASGLIEYSSLWTNLKGLGCATMETQVQDFLAKVQSDVTTNAAGFLSLPKKFTLESVISASVVFAIFYLASLLVKKVAEKFFHARKIDEALSRFLIRAMRISLVSLGAVSALGTLGIDVSVIVGGIGLTGLALGVALKDVVSNAVSGIMLLLFRTFRHNDRIKVAEFEGVVSDIDLRYTHLRTEGKIIYVPNSMMFANAVTVLSNTVATTEQVAKLVMPPAIEDLPDPPPPEPTVEQEAVRERFNPLMALADDRVAA
jgi:small-conductance mechanosensitive channel